MIFTPPPYHKLSYFFRPPPSPRSIMYFMDYLYDTSFFILINIPNLVVIYEMF